MSVVSLVPMTAVDHRAFAEAQIADYAAWLLQQEGAPSPLLAHTQARAEINDDLAAALLTGDLLWTALSAGHLTVGWLCVKSGEPNIPSGTAFLYQILVVPKLRRQGYGRAMLAAIEAELASRGFHELRLNVWDSNTPARHLYEVAGYQMIERLEGKRLLGKRLSFRAPESPP